MRIEIIRLLLVLLLLQGRAYKGNVNDDPELAGQRLEYEADVKIPKNGKVTIPFFPEFRFPPTCSISNKTHPKHSIYAEDTTATDHLILKGSVGDIAHYNCHGVKRDSDKNVQLVHDGIQASKMQPILLAPLQGHSLPGRLPRKAKTFPAALEKC